MIISVAGYKGGIGKTTTAIHLAGFFSREAPTLLVDGDPNRSALVWAQNGKLPFAVKPETISAKYIIDHKPQFTVIDTQARPSASELVEIAMGCDLLILPTTVRALDFDALVKTVEKIRSAGGNYKVLLNMVPPNSFKKSDEIIEVLQKSGIPVFRHVISRYTFIESLPMDGLLAANSKDSNAKMVWKQYNSVGKEILL